MFSSLSESGFIPTESVAKVILASPGAVLISFREWLHSYQISRLGLYFSKEAVLISFREWLHSYLRVREFVYILGTSSSHLFQRVASFLLNQSWRAWKRQSTRFSSLSESGFIPTMVLLNIPSKDLLQGSHLFQRVASFLLSEVFRNNCSVWELVLISFREWLHSYKPATRDSSFSWWRGSHLFQRVASFLLGFKVATNAAVTVVLISFREWLHSYSRLPRLFIHAPSGTWKGKPPQFSLSLS